MKAHSTGIPFNLPLLISGLIVLPAFMVLLAACANEDASIRLPTTFSGVVVGANGPVADAIVQIQGTPHQTKTAQDGRFTLAGLGGTAPVTITAWGAEHFIGWVVLDPKKPTWQEDGDGLRLSLKPLFDGDNHAYTWFQQDGVSGAASCGLCHREYKEWQADSHSQSAINPRFMTMFRGTNVAGQKGQLTQMVSMDKALPADPALPNYGPGFRLDNPNQTGTCATCHTPLAAKTPNTNTCAWSGCHSSLTADRAETTGKDVRGIFPVGLVGIGEEGVSCEFCHVIDGVSLDPKTQLPFADMPGILSLHLRRPPNGAHQFIGSLTDANREQVTYSPFLAQSQFCAACHYGVFGGVVSNMKMTGGTVIYNSYGEWLDSPYSNPDTGKTCQDCHMPRKDTQFSVMPEKGGVARDPGNYHDHAMPGGNSQALLWSAVSMNANATRDGNTVRVRVSVTNDKTGHAVPTDAPMRSVMLIVEAFDANGQPLPLQQGPTLPEWTGNYAGQAGKGFARILKDNWTGETPTSAFWRQVTVVEDTRLFPFKPDRSNYAFNVANGAVSKVNVKLVYRRAFQKLAQQKGWADPDMTMAEMSVDVK